VVARISSGGGPEERIAELGDARFGPFPLRVTGWTPDNRTVVFSGEAQGGLGLLPLSAAGARAAATLLGTAPSGAHNVRLSPNGRWVAYQASLDGGTVLGIFVDVRFPAVGGGSR